MVIWYKNIIPDITQRGIHGQLANDPYFEVPQSKQRADASVGRNTYPKDIVYELFLRVQLQSEMRGRFMRPPHFIMNETQEYIIRKSAEVVIRVQILFLRLSDDSRSDLGTDVPNTVETGVHKLRGLFLISQRRRKRD